MAISVFDMFKIGIGPSSSHTVGPMRAASTFTRRLEEKGLLRKVARVQITLYGSLAFTGRGHGTDSAVLLGLSGELPERVDPDRIDQIVVAIRERGSIDLAGSHSTAINEKTDVVFNKREKLPFHSNGMRFKAFDGSGGSLLERDFYSVGGGFVVSQAQAAADRIVRDDTRQPYPFASAAELLQRCASNGMSIAQIMLANERAWRSGEDIRAGLFTIWDAMQACIRRGCRQEGALPGGLGVPRRASSLHRALQEKGGDETPDPLQLMDWVNLYALAVNEENAAGGRVVTAPTNGAAGVIPAVLGYYRFHLPGSNDDGVLDFLLTAGAIGILYMLNASISGAEVGCQGEVGVACSMAAGGLTAALGGSVDQVENAAEIGMEHNLGLTCDPVGGLVQIPCIERNAMAAVKAINAQRLAMQGEGKHKVSLDKVIKTMRETGADMKNRYKETSRGGLAVNVIEC